MNTLWFVLAALVIGLATGRLIGAGLAFTHGRTRDDLIAGALGSLLTAVPVHLIGPTGYRETLPALLIGVSAALLATWLRRMATWKKEPLFSLMTPVVEVSPEQSRHDMLTTSEGTKLLLSSGRLVLDER